MPSIGADQLGSLLLQIFSASRTGDAMAFQRRAVECMGRHVAFDCAWWGRASFAQGEHRVHCSFAYELPDDIDERMNLTDRGNVVARRVVHEPGRAHYFSRADLHSQPSTAALTARTRCRCRMSALQRPREHASGGVRLFAVARSGPRQ